MKMRKSMAGHWIDDVVVPLRTSPTAPLESQFEDQPAPIVAGFTPADEGKPGTDTDAKSDSSICEPR
jgi:hypothetical protein